MCDEDFNCFRYTITQPPDGKWGGENADGTWNGMVGMVIRGVKLIIYYKCYRFIQFISGKRLKCDTIARRETNCTAQS